MTERREFMKAGAGCRCCRAWAGGRARAGAARGRGPSRPGPVRHRPGRGLVHDRDHHRVAGPVRNFGLGLVGYTWEENGPALAVRAGPATLEDAVEAMAACPSRTSSTSAATGATCRAGPGGSTSHPVWAATFDAARRHGLRVGFRVQLSNPEIQPARLALPDFLQARVPLVTLGAAAGGRARPGSSRATTIPSSSAPSAS